MFQALRIPDFRLLWAAGLISSLGSWLLVIAIPAHVLAATGSLRDTGLTLAAAYLPQLVLGPVAGAVADGWDRRRLMIAANLFCAGAVAVMLLGTSPGRYWVLYAALSAENTGAVLYAPALQARTPAIVGTGPLLSSANFLTSASSGIVRLIGGPLGGVLLAVCGIRWLICADTLSYLVSAGAMFMTSRSGGGHPDRDAVVSDMARDLIEGLRALRAQPVARSLLPVTVIFLTANASLNAVLIPFGIRRLGGSERTGLLLACLGAGYLLGAPVIRTLLDRAQPRNLLTASLTATAIAYVLLFTSSSLATALPTAVAVGVCGSMSLVIQQTTLQRVIPGAILGRVSAVFLTGEAAATLVGSVAGPFLAQAAHLTAVATAASLVTLGAAALAFRTVPRMPAIIPGSPPPQKPSGDSSARARPSATDKAARRATRVADGPVGVVGRACLPSCRSGDMSWHGMAGDCDGGGTDRATMALFRRHIDAEATAFAWTRTVDMEQQQWVGKRSGWQPSGETRNVERHQETYWETVTDWHPGPPNADGTPGPQQPITRQERRTRTFYTYEELEWRQGRTLTASGADRSEVHWPEYTLAPGERVRGKAETYSATFAASAKQYEATLDEAQWRTLALGTTYRLSLGLLGGVREVTTI